MVIMKCTGVHQSSPPLFTDGCMNSFISFSANSFLQFHDQKTEVLLFRPSDAASIHLDLEAGDNQSWLITQSLRLRLVVKASFLHLRRLAKFSSFISLYHLILAHALMTSCLSSSMPTRLVLARLCLSQPLQAQCLTTRL